MADRLHGARTYYGKYDNSHSVSIHGIREKDFEALPQEAITREFDNGDTISFKKINDGKVTIRFFPEPE